jgi:carbon monoxide dehydrogenase subunit G
MTWFSSRNVSVADVDAKPADIWAIVSSPTHLARLTPMVTSIDASGDRWRWRMTKISALGVGIAPTFTEQMDFDEGKAIRFRHEGDGERAGAEGTYELSDGPRGGTHLAVDITLKVDLPLPGVSRPAVERVMKTMMARTGARFAANLCRELGVAA